MQRCLLRNSGLLFIGSSWLKAVMWHHWMSLCRLNHPIVQQRKFFSFFLKASRAEVYFTISNNKRLIYAPHITLNMDDPPNWSNKMSRCSAAYNSPLSFFGFWNLTPLHIHLQTSNHSTGGRFLQHRPLLGPINLWWEQWLITREQEKIRPLRYWWFTIQFRGVNREPYLNCQCLIYTSCSCTKSAAAFFGLGGVLMEEAEGQVKLGRLPRGLLDFLSTLKWPGYTACG